MNPLGISFIVFACILAGTFLGRVLRDFLPEEQVTGDSKDAIKLGVGLVGTLTAMVLGLMVASAKGTYDGQRNGLAQLSTNVILLDRVLAHYESDAKNMRPGPKAAAADDGSSAKNVRLGLKAAVDDLLKQAWGGEASLASVMEAKGGSGVEDRYEALFEKIQDLPARNENQRGLKAQALKIATDIAQTRWQMFSQKDGSIPTPFVVVLVCWLTLILACFSLLAPRNTAALVTLLICVVAVSSAVFLIMELDQPFQGVFQISSAPLQNALAQLGR